MNPRNQENLLSHLLTCCEKIRARKNSINSTPPLLKIRTKVAEKLDKLDTMTNQKLEGQVQEVVAIIMQRHFEPNLPFSPR